MGLVAVVAAGLAELRGAVAVRGHVVLGLVAVSAYRESVAEGGFLAKRRHYRLVHRHVEAKEIGRVLDRKAVRHVGGVAGGAGIVEGLAAEVGGALAVA